MVGIPLVSIKKLAGNTAGIKRVESNLSQLDFSSPVVTRQEPEVELRKEVNISIIALKREANSLETVIQQAVQTLANINKQIADCVKKSDVTDTIQSDNMNPITSNAIANSNAIPVDTVALNNLHSVSSNAVYNQCNGLKMKEIKIEGIPSVSASTSYGFAFTDYGLTNDNVVYGIAIGYIAGNLNFDVNGIIFTHPSEKKFYYYAQYTQTNVTLSFVVFYK